MSKIDTLISQLCPDGVKRVRLGEVGSFYSGLSGKSKKDFEDGNAKFITYKNVYSNPALRIDVEDTVKIAPDEKQNTIKYGDILFTGSSETPDECAFSSVLNIHTDEKLYLNSFCFGYRFNDLNQIDIDFYKHYFRCLDMRKRIAKTANGTTRFNVSKKDFAQLEIPLPPLPIQAEIVKILDRFAVLTAELEAELEGRRKQYEYYRTRLLSFDSVSSSDSVRWMRLGEVCFSLKTGLNPRQNFKLNTEGANLPYITGKDIFGGKVNISNKTDLITQEAVDLINKRACLATNDLLFASTGTGTVGRMAIIENYENNWNISETLYAIKINNQIALTKFVKHYLDSQNAKSQYEPNISRGSVPHLKVVDLLKVSIPIPSLSEQERIVNILDKFDQLVNGIKDSIPALIDDVQKQYEFYRNKLLTFPE